MLKTNDFYDFYLLFAIKCVSLHPKRYIWKHFWKKEKSVLLSILNYYLMGKTNITTMVVLQICMSIMTLIYLALVMAHYAIMGYQQKNHT